MIRLSRLENKIFWIKEAKKGFVRLSNIVRENYDCRVVFQRTRKI